MLAIAIVKDNDLIIPNIDLSAFDRQIGEFGMIEIDLRFLDKAEKLTALQANNPSPKIQNKTMTVDEAFNAITIETNKVATIEYMNESIAKVFKNWQG